MQLLFSKYNNNSTLLHEKNTYLRNPAVIMFFSPSILIKERNSHWQRENLMYRHENNVYKIIKYTFILLLLSQRFSLRLTAFFANKIKKLNNRGDKSWRALPLPSIGQIMQPCFIGFYLIFSVNLCVNEESGG